MKVLFIGSQRYDYVQDIVYSGLVKLLGQKNVIESNWNKKYHIPYKKYPKNIGYFKHSILDSIHLTNGNFDLVVLATTRPDCFKNYIKLAPKISPKVPVVYIDGGDRCEVGGDLERLGEPQLFHKAQSIRDFDLIFKREMKIDTSYAKNVFPLTIGFNFSRLPKEIAIEKKYQVAFWAQDHSHSIRGKALNLLKNRFDCDTNGTHKGNDLDNYKRRGDFYLKELAACKINLSLQGGGFDTLRYWEIPAVGSLLLSEPADIIIPNDFEHKKNAIFCQPSLDDLLDLCKYYLKHESKREKIALSGQRHIYEFHTDVHRAQYILGKVERIS